MYGTDLFIPERDQAKETRKSLVYMAHSLGLLTNKSADEINTEPGKGNQVEEVAPQYANLEKLLKEIRDKSATEARTRFMNLLAK
jgi:hypothetical protein